ncbi:MAG: ribbon-helix-helix domain-containing protein [Candidatus Thorarchaeota archaeon]
MSGDIRTDGKRKKIISVTMSQSMVEQIDRLVEQDVARSRAQLIEDAVRWFIEYTVHKWNERGIYVNSCRMALEPDTMSSLFFSKLTPNDQYELGLTAGARSSIEDIARLHHRITPGSPASRAVILRILQDLGWGMLEESNDLILVGSPFYPPQFMKGFLESLLRIRTELVETHAKDNMALRIL